MNDSKAFIEYWQCMDNVYSDIGDYNPSRERKVLLVFDDIVIVIAGIMTNKKLKSYSSDAGNWIFQYSTCICLSVLFCSSKKNQIIFFALLNHKIYSKRELKVLPLIIQQTLITKTLWRFIGNVQVKLILFWLLILHYLLIIL